MPIELQVENLSNNTEFFSGIDLTNTSHGYFYTFKQDAVIGGQLRTNNYKWEELSCFEWLKKENLLPNNFVLVDIGANLGTTCISLIKNKYCSKAIAIEAEATNHRLLTINIAQNGLETQILSYWMALGDFTGMVPLKINFNNRGDHRVYRQESNLNREDELNRPTAMVWMDTIDRLMSLPEVTSFIHHPLVIWLDAQGYEGFIFLGGKRLFGTKPLTITEFWPYGIEFHGMTLEEYWDILSQFWTCFIRLDTYAKYPLENLVEYWDYLEKKHIAANIVLI